MSRQEFIEIDVECSLDEQYFEDLMDEKMEEFWGLHGPVPCEGTGQITSMCANCKFCIRYERLG